MISQLNGTLKDSSGNPRIFSNWTIHSNGNDLYRPSGNVGIGTTDFCSYKLYVNGTTYINGTITAPTFSGALSGTATYTSNVHVSNKNGENTTYKMMFCNSSGWQSTSNIMCDDDSSNGPRYNPYFHTLYCNIFNGSLNGTATYTSNVHVSNKNGVSGTYKMMFCNGSGWQSTSNIMCDDDSSNDQDISQPVILYIVIHFLVVFTEQQHIVIMFMLPIFK